MLSVTKKGWRVELAGHEVPVIWQGRRVDAFVPMLLADRDLSVDARAAGRCGAAEQSVASSAEALPDDFAPLARLLLRAEGIASSYIEGVMAPVVDVVLAEYDNTGQHSPAAWVAANLAATQQAVAHASAAAALTVDELCRWHIQLMEGSPTPARHVGRIRDEQGWIGGPTPLGAHLVTPPPTELGRLLTDLLLFANRTDVNPVEQAAVTHAQFELIHPFADGNGRIGRVLVSWQLTRRLRLLTPPPVSVRLAADVGGYTAGLTQYRFGHTSAWVAWFAAAVSGAGREQQQLIAAVEQLRRDWQDRLAAHRGVRSLRSDASAWRVLALLPRHLVLTARLVADELALTRKAAGAALHTLTDAGLLSIYTAARPAVRGRPTQFYFSADLLGLVGASPLRR